MLSKRVMVLFDPGEYNELKDVAVKEKKSVAEIIRESVRKVFLEPRKVDFRKHPAFGMWAHDPRSDEEILNEISGNWKGFGEWGDA